MSDDLKSPSPEAIAPFVVRGSLNAPATVFTCGCFDVLHFGHAKFLRACRLLGEKLIVGLNSDASVKRLKGPLRPICTEVERWGLLEELRSVDEVILFDEDTPCELIRRLKPDVIVKGPGYSEANMPETAIVKAYGGRVVILPGPEISSTSIIERVRRDA